MKNPSYRDTLVEGLPPALRERVQARLAAERKEQEKSNPTKPPKMRRFHLRRAAYLADLEARWSQLIDPP